MLKMPKSLVVDGRSLKLSQPYSIKKLGIDSDEMTDTDIIDALFGEHVFHNFMIGDKIFILDEITGKNTSKLVATMSVTIDDMALHAGRVISDLSERGKQITVNDLPVIDVYINSPGGEVAAYQTINGFLTMAKMQNILVRTYVFGLAASAASLLAVQGTPGLRVMAKGAEHMVHFGGFYQMLTKDSEIEKAKKHAERFSEMSKNTYLKNTVIKAAQLQKLMEDEQGYLEAEQCLELGFCDSILSPIYTKISNTSQQEVADEGRVAKAARAANSASKRQQMAAGQARKARQR